MNRGSSTPNIPGYYYDTEKQKYFKIQPSHRLPQGAKYSQGNVEQDKREFKKRKVERDRQSHIERQTVKRAPVLRAAAIGGTGLLPELGNTGLTRRLADRDTAYVNELVATNRQFASLRENGPEWPHRHAIYDHQYMPRYRQSVSLVKMHMKYGPPINLINVNTADRPMSDSARAPIRIRANRDTTVATGGHVTSFSAVETSDTSRILLAACMDVYKQPGNIYTALLTDSGSGPDEPKFVAGCEHFALLGSASTRLWDLSRNHDKSTIAVAGTLGVWALGQGCSVLGQLSITRRDYAEPEDDETVAVDWLDNNTIVAGSEQIYLWDRRSGGTSQRYHLKARVTGILNPSRSPVSDENGTSGQNTIVVSTNHKINLFDVRYVTKSRPLFSWDHQHQGPQLSVAANGMGLIAAVDRDNYVHLYSTQTGGHVRRLPKPTNASRVGMVEKLRWEEDERGSPALQALQNGNMLQWRWIEPPQARA